MEDLDLITQKIKELRSLKAGDDFKRRSFSAIVAQARIAYKRDLRLNIFESITLGAAIVLSSILLILVFGGSLMRRPTLAENPDFNIELAEVNYFDEDKRTEVAVRLEALERQIRFDRDLVDSTRNSLLSEVNELKSILK